MSQLGLLQEQELALLCRYSNMAFAWVSVCGRDERAFVTLSATPLFFLEMLAFSAWSIEGPSISFPVFIVEALTDNERCVKGKQQKLYWNRNCCRAR